MIREWNVVGGSDGLSKRILCLDEKQRKVNTLRLKDGTVYTGRDWTTVKWKDPSEGLQDRVFGIRGR